MISLYKISIIESERGKITNFGDLEDQN